MPDGAVLYPAKVSRPPWLASLVGRVGMGWLRTARNTAPLVAFKTHSCGTHAHRCTVLHKQQGHVHKACRHAEHKQASGVCVQHTCACEAHRHCCRARAVHVCALHAMPCGLRVHAMQCGLRVHAMRRTMTYNAMHSHVTCAVHSHVTCAMHLHVTCAMHLHVNFTCLHVRHGAARPVDALCLKAASEGSA
eukprot:365214-Chlamydomonas_euryale.AAC.6